MTADLPLVKVPINWMKPLRDRLKMMLALDGCDWKQSGKPVVVYVNRSELLFCFRAHCAVANCLPSLFLTPSSAPNPS